MKASLIHLGLAAIFASAAACGQKSTNSTNNSSETAEAQTFQATDEEGDEASFLAEEGTGETPADLLNAKLSDGTETEFTPSEKAQVSSKYSYLDPGHVVPSALLSKAVAYFEANQSRFANKAYISVIDFSKKSSKTRFWIINMKTGAVWAMHVAHGSGSDTNRDGYAESFSNVSGSNKSSLGYYRTGETYIGKHGLSMRLDGLSTTNSNVRSRAIVLHSATYVTEASVIQGRSNGCPAVTQANKDKLIAQIKNGALIYADLSGVR